MRNKKFIVVGATGLVGREMIEVLEEFGVACSNITAVASERSAGSTLPYADEELEVKNIRDADFTGHDIALFSAGGKISEIYAPKATASGCIVIDNTSFFRMHKEIPLIVPEINFEAFERYNSKIIANPNCSTIQMVMVLKPLHDEFGLQEVVVSTYQSVSGAGQRGVEELREQTKKALEHEKAMPAHFKKQIAFNLIPQIDDFTDSLYTKEELKMMNETQKILDIPNLSITATCVRVPVFVGHAVSVTARFKNEVDIDKAIESLQNFPGVEIIDAPERYDYATPIDVAKKDVVYVSRLRKHPSDQKALSFWCVADNLRKGAALNAVQIAQKLCAIGY